jgi:hypothetical protein
MSDDEIERAVSEIERELPLRLDLYQRIAVGQVIEGVYADGALDAELRRNDDDDGDEPDYDTLIRVLALALGTRWRAVDFLDRLLGGEHPDTALRGLCDAP